MCPLQSCALTAALIRSTLTTQPTAEQEAVSSQEWLFAFAFTNSDPQRYEDNVTAELILCDARGTFTTGTVRVKRVIHGHSNYD